MSPEEFILLLQTNYPDPIPPTRSADIRTALDRTGRRLGLPAEDVDRMIETVVDYLDSSPRIAENDRTIELMLHQAIRNVLPVLDRMAEAAGNPTFPRATFATLPTAWPNACTLRMPASGEYVVAFTAGLPVFINRMAKAVIEIHHLMDADVYDYERRHSEQWPAIFGNHVERVVAARPLLVDRFLRTLMSFASGAPITEPHVLPQPAYYWRFLVLAGAEEFVVAHEYAHFTEGHNTDAGRSGAQRAHDSEVEAVQRSHEEEFRADHIGYAISTVIAVEDWKAGHYDQDGYACRTAGATLFLVAAGIFEELRTMVPHSPWGMDTHPPSSARVAALRKVYASITGFPPNPFSIEYEVILQHLWKSAKELFNSLLHEVKKRPG